MESGDKLKNIWDVLEIDEVFDELYYFASLNVMVDSAKDEYFDTCPDIEEEVYGLADVTVNVVESSTEEIQELRQKPTLSSYNKDELKVMYAYAIAAFYQSEYVKQKASNKAEAWKTDRYMVDQYETSAMAYKKGYESYVESHPLSSGDRLLEVIVEIYDKLGKEKYAVPSNNC